MTIKYNLLTTIAITININTCRLTITNNNNNNYINNHSTITTINRIVTLIALTNNN